MWGRRAESPPRVGGFVTGKTARTRAAAASGRRPCRRCVNTISSCRFKFYPLDVVVRRVACVSYDSLVEHGPKVPISPSGRCTASPSSVTLCVLSLTRATAPAVSPTVARLRLRPRQAVHLAHHSPRDTTEHEHDGQGEPPGARRVTGNELCVT